MRARTRWRWLMVFVAVAAVVLLHFALLSIWWLPHEVVPPPENTPAIVAVQTDPIVPTNDTAAATATPTTSPVTKDSTPTVNQTAPAAPSHTMAAPANTKSVVQPSSSLSEPISSTQNGVISADSSTHSDGTQNAWAGGAAGASNAANGASGSASTTNTATAELDCAATIKPNTAAGAGMDVLVWAQRTQDGARFVQLVNQASDARSYLRDVTRAVGQVRFRVNDAACGGKRVKLRVRLIGV